MLHILVKEKGGDESLQGDVGRLKSNPKLNLISKIITKNETIYRNSNESNNIGNVATIIFLAHSYHAYHIVLNSYKYNFR